MVYNKVDLINKYRELTNDKNSSEEQIKNKITFLENFCRNVIKIELETYVKSKKQNQSKGASV
jgi:hypothetical protein